MNSSNALDPSIENFLLCALPRLKRPSLELAMCTWSLKATRVAWGKREHKERVELVVELFQWLSRYLDSMNLNGEPSTRAPRGDTATIEALHLFALQVPREPCPAPAAGDSAFSTSWLASWWLRMGALLKLDALKFARFNGHTGDFPMSVTIKHRVVILAIKNIQQRLKGWNKKLPFAAPTGKEHRKHMETLQFAVFLSGQQRVAATSWVLLWRQNTSPVLCIDNTGGGANVGSARMSIIWLYKMPFGACPSFYRAWPILWFCCFFSRSFDSILGILLVFSCDCLHVLWTLAEHFMEE